MLLFLDYDGTLAPIVEHASEAALPEPARRDLEKLSRQGHVVTAIISGRGLADVRERVGLPNLLYAGNHGLEIEGRGLRFVEPRAAELREPLEALCEKLRAEAAHIPGAEVENKGLSASMHFRRAAPGAEEELLAIVRAALAGQNDRFLIRMGKKIYEVRPRVQWNKGNAVRWIRERLGGEGSLGLYFGDDSTDEDAFEALADGVTVKVGEPGRTAATYNVSGPEQVHRFLAWLAGIRGENQ